MGAGSSVRNTPTETWTSSVCEALPDGATPTEDFEACAKHLAAKYHDLRLHNGVDSSSKGSAAPYLVVDHEASPTSIRPLSLASPLAQADKKRLLRQSWRHSRHEQTEGVEITPASPLANAGQRNGANKLRRKTLPDVGITVNTRVSDKAVGERLGESPPSKFVYRDDMAKLARDLGYNVTPEQSMEMFDMLDSGRLGKISKDNLFTHFLPLLQKMVHNSPPRKGSKGWRHSMKGASPKRPRPSGPHPMGTKTPPRPAGTPPPTAQRRSLSPLPLPGRRESHSADPGPLRSTSSSPPQGRQDHTIETLDPASTLNKFVAKPSNFWITSRGDDGGDAPVSDSLVHFRGSVKPAEKDEKVEEEDHVMYKEAAEEKKDPVARAETEENLEPTNSLSKEARGIVEEDAADKNTGVEILSAREGGNDSERCSTTSASDPATADFLRKNVLDWTTADVQAWVRALPRGLAAFAGAEAFAEGRVDGKKLATLTLPDIKRKEFHHANFKAKIPTALWIEIKRIQQTAPPPAEAAVPVHYRFSPEQVIVDEAVGTTLCTVKKSVGQGAFGEVYQVVWTGIGADWGSTLAMKTVRLADISSSERDEYRILLMEEILTAIRVKPHPNLVNVRFAHIMGFCSESEEYICFEDFVTGRNLEDLIAEGKGELYDGTVAEVQGRLLSYSIQLARGLGHIHRCGVLHQDMKSANIMVSSDAGLLIADFGFASVGKFGPPPPPSEKLANGPAATTDTATTADARPSLTGLDEPEARAGDSTVPSPYPPTGTIGPKSGGIKESGILLGRIPAGDPRDQQNATQRGAKEDGGAQKESSGDIDRPPNLYSVLFGTLKGFTPRYQSPEVGTIMRKKEMVKKAAAAVAQVAGSLSKNIAPQDLSQSREGGNHTVIDDAPTPFTHRSDMWAAGVVVLEMYAGGLEALKAGQGDNAPGLLEALVGDTYASTRSVTEGEGAAGGKEGEEETFPREFEGCGRLPQPEAAAGEREVVDGNCTKNRHTFRVDMPEGVIAVLREIFHREAENRPASMEVVESSLSRTLEDMLKKKRAVVPCPTSGSPSPLSLCEQAPISIEHDENHAKVGRLHMWLGKALFLKGEDRREQALEEYREGVRVLEESTSDRRSPSMALFRWYLGKALLEAGKVDEALSHLTEAVSIDPENAKYRHALGLAKCATGDEAGARDDLLEAALLDEEDAEDRYQLRLQRIREKRDKIEKEQRALSETREAGEAGTSQGVSSSLSGGEDVVGVAHQPGTPPRIGSPPTTSGLAESQLLAIEKASASTRTYALENFGDIRSTRAFGRGGGDLRGGAGAAMDVQSIQFGAKSLRDTTTPTEFRRFSLGDEILCTLHASAPAKPFEPMRSYQSSPCVSGHDRDKNNGSFIIDGFLSSDQASLSFSGEAYTATSKGLQSQHSPGDSSGAGNNSTYHIVYTRFGSAKSRRHVSKSTPPTAEPASFVASNGVKQLAPIEERSQKVCRVDGDNTQSNPAASAGVSSSSSSKARRGLAQTNYAPAVNSTYFQREKDFVPMLKAAGRAAMIGFHAHVAGTMYKLLWGAGELTMIASSIPAESFTLREACVSGDLYRGTAMVPVGGNQRHRTLAEEPNAKVVVDRILQLSRQTAEAISHCHRRGVLLRDITPKDVLVIPHWKAMLRPNYLRAYEGQSWRTVSIREREKHEPLSPSPSSSDGEVLTAPFTDTTSLDYQSPEIARIRREKEPHQRISGRAMRLAAVTTSSSTHGRVHQEEPHHPLSSTGPRRRHTSDTSRVRERGDGGKGGVRGVDSGSDGRDAALDTSTSIVSNTVHHLQDDRGSIENEPTVNRAKRAGDSQTSSDPPKGGVAVADKSIAPSSPSSGAVPGTTSGGRSGGALMLSPCESDIWAWALMVLQMFSNEVWPPGKGQKGLVALEALLQRRQGVELWDSEDVVSWLRDIGLWSEKAEREIRAFRINGRKLLVPTCRRDIVEKLGLFIDDGELSCKLWESVVGGLQRWSMPPRVAELLRKCLADIPGDRFSTMFEVCKLLRGIATSEAQEGDSDKLLNSNDGKENVASDRLRSGRLLNDIGVCFYGRGQIGDAERYFKMALLSSDEVVEAFYNLGLLYMRPEFSKFREAQQMFDVATERMSDSEPLRQASIEFSRTAQRKSIYYQSQEMMKALSGKYGSISQNEKEAKHHRRSVMGTERALAGKGRTNRRIIEDSDKSRRQSLPLKQQKFASSSKPLASLSRASPKVATTGSGVEVAESTPSS